MKASKLITSLRQHIDDFGDCDVHVFGKPYTDAKDAPAVRRVDITYLHSERNRVATTKQYDDGDVRSVFVLET